MPILPLVQPEFLSGIFSDQCTAGQHQEKEQPQNNWVGTGFQPRVKNVGMSSLAGLCALCIFSAEGTGELIGNPGALPEYRMT